MPLDHRAIKSKLKDYFDSKNICSRNEYRLFDHPDDESEKSFSIDFATKLYATKGDRDDSTRRHDKTASARFAEDTKPVIDVLRDISLFPGLVGETPGWQLRRNKNPMVGIAIEIENNLRSKYFLGSFLAASIAGAWGIVVVEDGDYSERWVQTLKRMIGKGDPSPIPSNVLVLAWPAFDKYISEALTAALEARSHPLVREEPGSTDTLSSPHPPGD